MNKSLAKSLRVTLHSHLLVSSRPIITPHISVFPCQPDIFSRLRSIWLCIFSSPTQGELSLLPAAGRITEMAANGFASSWVDVIQSKKVCPPRKIHLRETPDNTRGSLHFLLQPSWNCQVIPSERLTKERGPFFALSVRPSVLTPAQSIIWHKGHDFLPPP